MLAAVEEAFYARDPGSGDGAALMALAKATVLVAPEKAKSLLMQKGVDYWDTTEFLVTFLAKQSLEDTLQLAETEYAADPSNRENFLGAALTELARIDFPRAFARIKTMRGTDPQAQAYKLAHAMIALKRDQEAHDVIAYLNTFSKAQDWVKRLQREMQEAHSNEIVSFTPHMIDDFIASPNVEILRTMLKYKPMTFRDKEQARRCVASALPLLDDIMKDAHSTHDTRREQGIGLLALCSALGGDTLGTLDMVKRLPSVDLQVSYLLSASELMNPLPPPLAEWPIHSWSRTPISLQ